MTSQATMIARLERQQQALTGIGRRWRSYEGHFDRAIEAITETAAYAFGIERVSVWFYSPERTAIICHDLYEATPRRHSSGLRLEADDFPDYFRALESEEVIAAKDALTDPRTCEFATGYLESSGIGAMLDAPIRAGGAATGVLCHEHVGGPRIFHEDEINCAIYLASMVSAALELDHRRKQELESRRALSLLRATFEASGSALLALDLDGRITDYNQMAVDLWQLTPGLLAGSNGRDLMVHMAEQVEDPGHFIARTRAVQSQPRTQSHDVVTLADGRVVECTSQPQYLDGVVAGRVWSFRDISRQHRIEQELRERSNYDPLTGLCNRRRIDEVLEQEILRVQRSGTPLCVAMLDIDHFKQINDTHGHPVGDEVLKVLASDLRDKLRGTDFIGRWGGEEFTLVLPDTRIDGARAVMESVRELLSRKRTDIPEFTVSIGIAEFTKGLTAKSLMALVDKRLYAAKAAGRNRVES